MESKTLLRLSLAVSVIGVIAFIVLYPILIKEASIADLRIGEAQTVSGTISGFKRNSDGHVFFKISDRTGEIDVVAFKNYNIETADILKNKDNVRVTGLVKLYKGRLEIVAREIELL